MNQAQWKWLRVLLLSAMLLSGISFAAALSPAVQRSLSWLQSQVQGDGSMANESSSVATPLQNRAETLQSLALLANAPTSLNASVAADLENNTEFVARRMISLAAAGQDVNSLTSIITTRQNADGGFGGADGFDSSPLDTAWALLALNAAGQAGPVPAAIGYLQSVQQSDGSYLANQRADIYTSAYVLSALRLHAARYVLGGNIQPLVAYLTQQQSNGSWGDSSFLTAVVYQAIHDFIPLEPTASAVRAYLEAGQGTDGSWGGDAYATALVARALQMTGEAPVNPTMASIKGKVIDGETKLPLANLVVSLSGPQSPSLLSASDGTFKFTDLPAGSYTLQAALSNYGAVTATTSVSAGQVLDFGTIPLTKTQTATTGKIYGTIKDASNGSPLAGVTISVKGQSLSAVTNSAGEYQISNAPSGSVELTAVKSGYYSRSAIGQLSAGGVLLFAPTLSATDPNSQNSSWANLSLTIVDATTNTPIPNVQITIRGAGEYIRNTNTSGAYAEGMMFADANGGFGFKFSIANYPTTEMYVYTNGTNILNLGQIRMRRSLVNAFAPDLSIARINRKAAAVDPLTLQLSGKVAVSLLNRGTADSPAGISVLAFADNNRNGRFDTGIDQILGSEKTQSVLRPNQTSILEIPVQGQQMFRDAPIAVWIDSDQKLVELNKSNNIGSSADYMFAAPANDAITPKLKWSNSSLPMLAHTPIVGPISDTNGDGKIDGNDAPAIIIAYADLYAVDARDGHVLWNQRWDSLGLRLPGYFPPSSTPALGDIDGDGKPEIVSLLSDHSIIALNADGRVKWISSERTAPSARMESAVVLADIDGDGKAEVLANDLVLNSNGTVRWRAQSGADVYVSIPLVVDLERDGHPKIVMGRHVYNEDGTLFWSMGSYFSGHGYPVPMKVDDDEHPKLVVSGANRLTAFNHDGSLYWGPLLFPNGYNGMSPPTIADIDGDNQPDILVVGTDGLRALNSDGSLKWIQKIDEASSQTVATAFDFFGNGKMTVVYSDQSKLHFYDGKTGQEVASAPTYSPTWREHPIIADIDNDGHADIVVPGSPTQVFSDVNNAWVPASNAWNQINFTPREVNSSLKFTSPTNVDWRKDSHYRMNVPLPQGDVTVSLPRITDNGLNAPSLFKVRVGNAGGAVVPAGVAVAFYSGDPAQGGVFLGQANTAQTLLSGQYEEVSFSYPQPLSDMTALYVVVDDDGTGKHSFNDVDRNNNSVALNLSALPGSFGVAVTTDVKSVGANTDIPILLQVTNHGSFAGATSVRISILAANGELVATLPAQSLSMEANASQTITNNWNTGLTFAGAYQVRAELLDLNGLPYSEAIASFSISAGEQILAAKVSSDKQTYLSSDTVTIQTRIANLAVNLLQEDLRTKTELLSVDGSVRWQQQDQVMQLLAASLKDFTYSLPLANAPAGNYMLRLTVSDKNGRTLASATSAFTVQSTALSGVGLSGSIVATQKQVPLGDAAIFSFSVTNRGNASISDLPLTISIVDPDNQKLIGTLSDSITLTQGELLQHGSSWQTSGVAGKTYLAVLQATVGGKAVTLGFDSFSLTAPPIKIAVSQAQEKTSRVLVLINCHPNWWLEGIYNVLDHKSACFSQRSSFIDKWLTDRGVQHLVTTNVEAFTQAFQSGRYNSYWVLGAIDPFAKPLMDELREAVNRGDSLLLDGGAAAWKNLELYEMTGTRYAGRLLFSKQQMQLDGALFAPMSISTEGTPLRLQVTTGVVQASYERALCYKVEDANGELDGASVLRYPAIVSNGYGLGKAIAVGFDLVGTMMHSGDTNWNTILDKIQGYLVPEPQGVTPNGGYFALTTTLQNQGQAVRVRVKATLPIGAKYLESFPVATLDDQGQPAWVLDLAKDQAQSIKLAISAPKTSGYAVLTTEVSTDKGGNIALYGQYTASLNSVGADTLSGAVLGSMQGLATQFLTERIARDLAILRFKSGMNWLSRGFYGFGVADLADAAEHLRTIKSIDVTSIRLDLDRILQEAEIRKVAARQ